MDLQPDTFVCFSVHRTKGARISSLRIRTYSRLDSLAIRFIAQNMRTFALLLPIPRPARSQRVFPPFVLRLFNFWPTTRTFSSWARSWGAGSVQPRDRGCRVNAVSYVHALHVERAICPACIGPATALAGGGLTIYNGHGIMPMYLWGRERGLTPSPLGLLVFVILVILSRFLFRRKQSRTARDLREKHEITRSHRFALHGYHLQC